jgi:exonuclease I
VCQPCLESTGVTVENFEEFRRYREKVMRSQYCIINSFRLQKLLDGIKDPKYFAALGIDDRLIWVTHRQTRLEYSMQQRKQFGRQLFFHVYIKNGS